MLIIRNAQLFTLARPRWEAFIRQVAEHLDHHFPGHGHADPALSEALSRARSRGLLSAQSLMKYANVVAVLGLDFETRLRWTAEYLDDTAVADPEERVHRLHQELLKRIEWGQPV